MLKAHSRTLAHQTVVSLGWPWRNAANDLVATLVFARSEAVKRNADVTVSRVGSGWKDGWTVTYDDGGTQTARQHPALNSLSVAASPDVASLTFGGGGRVDAAINFTLDTSPQTTGVDARCVEVRSDGMPRVWVERGGNHDCSDD